MSRAVIRNIESREQDEGVGAKVRRSIGNREIRNFDPFLLLDEFRVAPPAGFPDHPHRGLETVTYMLKGNFHHEDFTGHKGIIEPGGVQWMTAGRGVLHSEMPIGAETTHGLQLWVNLSRDNKMITPVYQELKSTEIPERSHDGVHVRIIAGESMGTKSRILTRTPTMFLDFKLDPNTSFTQSISSEWNAFISILNGEGIFGSNNVKGNIHHTLILNHGDSVCFKNESHTQLHFLLIAGKPLYEPIVQHGTFAMNTKEEIANAIMDYQFFRNGFENAKYWSSEGIEMSLNANRYF